MRVHNIIFATILSAISLEATSGTVPNGQQCSDRQEKVGGIPLELLEEMNSRCQSNQCYPGPTVGRSKKTEWYCVSAGKNMNCAFPGSNGERYGTKKVYGGVTVICRRPNGNRPGNPARFSD